VFAHGCDPKLMRVGMSGDEIQKLCVLADRHFMFHDLKFVSDVTESGPIWTISR
jgi:hypothetical protein